MSTTSFVEPGPGNYMIDNNVALKHQPSWKIGSSLRSSISGSIKTPGPGN